MGEWRTSKNGNKYYYSYQAKGPREKKSKTTDGSAQEKRISQRPGDEKAAKPTAPAGALAPEHAEELLEVLDAQAWADDVEQQAADTLVQKLQAKEPLDVKDLDFAERAVKSWGEADENAEDVDEDTGEILSKGPTKPDLEKALKAARGEDAGGEGDESGGEAKTPEGGGVVDRAAKGTPGRAAGTMTPEEKATAEAAFAKSDETPLSRHLKTSEDTVKANEKLAAGFDKEAANAKTPDDKEMWEQRAEKARGVAAEIQQSVTERREVDKGYHVSAEVPSATDPDKSEFVVRQKGTGQHVRVEARNEFEAKMIAHRAMKEGGTARGAKTDGEAQGVRKSARKDGYTPYKGPGADRSYRNTGKKPVSFEEMQARNAHYKKYGGPGKK